MITTPKHIWKIIAYRPLRLTLPRLATISAPATAPAPETAMNVEVPFAAAWKTEAANTAKKAINCVPRKVDAKERKVNERNASLRQTKLNPSRISLRRPGAGPPRGMKRRLSDISATITARKETPLKPKLTAAAKICSGKIQNGMLPTVGPTTRARWN